MFSNLRARFKPTPQIRQLAQRTATLIFWSPSVLLPISFFDVRYITGTSMTPTLNPDTSDGRDIAFFEGWSTRTQRQFTRGDIVSLTSPADPNKSMVKRIVALPGDIVQTLPPHPEPTVQVPKYHVWVEGDEWFHSDGSNNFGPVPVPLIRSRLVCLLWPPNRFGFVPQRPSTTDFDSPAYERAMITIQQQSRIRFVSKPTYTADISNA